MARRKEYLRIGVTGGIGSGKSSACDVFARLGRTVISADSIAHTLTDSDRDLKEEIRRHFGDGVFLPNFTLNRKELARIVFDDASLLRQLNEIVHPRVFEEIDRSVEALPPSKLKPFIVIEAALIFESGMDEELDYVIVVVADEETRLERIERRDGVPREDVLKRMSAQLSSAETKKDADFVIENDDTLLLLEARVKFIDTILAQLAAPERM